MKISVFAHDNGNGLVDWLTQDLKQAGHEVIIGDGCLCRQPDKLASVVLADATLLHPADYTDCFQRISKFVDMHPQNKFYVLALQEEARKSPRVSGIGSHPNLVYLTEENIWPIFEELCGGNR